MYKKTDCFFDKKENETSEQFIIRLCSKKEEFGLSWEDIAEISNEVCGYSFGESYYRKKFKQYIVGEVAQSVTKAIIEKEEIEEDKKRALEDILIDIRNEKQRLADERTTNNALLRRLSREDNIRSIAIETAKEISKRIILSTPEDECSTFSCDENSAVLSLSDWHYGIDVSNYWNTYNIDVAEKRIKRLLDKTIAYCNKNKITKLVVLNLGDLISGRIHSEIRINNQIDVITQVMRVSEILAEFLNELSFVCQVEFYSATDNHSRVEPNLKESLELESLARITPWFIKERLKDNPDVVCCDNVFDDGIISFDIEGWKCIGVHGHEDKENAVVSNMSLMTNYKPDIIFTAHRHHLSSDEQNECIVIGNPSLMGTDVFAKRNRFTSRPAQIITVIGKDAPIEDIHYISL